MRLRRKGKRLRTSYLEVRVLASPVALGRAGIVVPKHKRTVVERNRLKRRLRELCRTELLPNLREMDILVRAMPETYDQSFDVLKRDVWQIAAMLASMTVQKN
jgi:ribonuclease P protein component